MNTPQTWRDPIVEEIHAIRECLAKQYDNDLAAYSQAADTHCRALGGVSIWINRCRNIHGKLRNKPWRHNKSINLIYHIA